MEIWITLHQRPQEVKAWYRERSNRVAIDGKERVYEQIKADYNKAPNGADLLFLCRACYGGVVRFRKVDGYMSTPCGVHEPVSPTSFDDRVDQWYRRTQGTEFVERTYKEAFREARRGDLIYCDPPYSDSQAILYGAQEFRFSDLLTEIDSAKQRGVFVALSIDGTKKSGSRLIDLELPQGLFEQEIFVNVGRSMLKRFQMNGQSLEGEIVADRLLLTY
jgi:DNA adenine methylase